nr:uncharacterized protein LOC109167071 [Ipomoea batatas]
MSEVVQMLSNLSMSIPVPLAPPELAPPRLDDDCSTVCSSEGSINEMSVSEYDEGSMNEMSVSEDDEGSMNEMSVSEDDEYLR